MRALILAAGFGKKLRPLTNHTPKPLIKVGNTPVLERAVEYLKKYGVNEFMVNTHHLADKIESFIKTNPKLKDLNILYEKEILDTGGAIKNAGKFLKDSNPSVIFNADIVSEIDLNPAIEQHKKQKNLVTLIVQERRTKNPLFFDKNGLLIDQRKFNEKARKKYIAKGFSCVHIVDRKLYELFPEQDIFKIFDFYFDLVNQGYKIGMYEAPPNSVWFDIGTPEKLKQANDYYKNNTTSR